MGASSATWTDNHTGLETRIEHLPTERGFLYCWSAVPRGAKSCVIICSGVFADFQANYHRERILGDTLAERGIGAVRFHYSGEGNSSGQRDEMTFDTLCDDTNAVIEHFVRRGIPPVALVGSRLGGFVVAKVALSMPDSPLVLWQPLIEPLAFLNEAQRAKTLSLISHDTSSDATDWESELDDRGMLDLLGYEVYRTFIDSLRHLSLLELLGETQRPLLIAQFRSRSVALEPFIEDLRSQSHLVEVEAFDVVEPWWFDRETEPDLGGLIPVTVDWLMERTTLPGEGA